MILQSDLIGKRLPSVLIAPGITKHNCFGILQTSLNAAFSYCLSGSPMSAPAQAWKELPSLATGAKTITLLRWNHLVTFNQILLLLSLFSKVMLNIGCYIPHTPMKHPHTDKRSMVSKTNIFLFMGSQNTCLVPTYQHILGAKDNSEQIGDMVPAPLNLRSSREIVSQYFIKIIV